MRATLDGACMSGPVADLHVHTTVSDGQLTLPRIPAAAREAGVEAVAVTDHDRYHPGFDAPVERRDGVTLIRGIELRAEAPSERVDLLGYGLEPTPELTAEVERIQRDRVDRGRRIIENVEATLGVDLGLEPREGLGRPHIARAIADSDADYGYEAAFDELIGDDGPCFVARDVPDFEAGRELLSEACSVVGLAHPLRYDDPEAVLALTADLDAVELYYPYDRPLDPDDPAGLNRDPVERAVAEHDLLATGGTDAHDFELGLAGPGRNDYDRFRERLPEPVVRD